jgi:hypothetical protein
LFDVIEARTDNPLHLRRESYPLHQRCGFSYKGKLCLPQVLQHGGGPQQYKQILCSTIKKKHYFKLNFDIKIN